MSWFWFALSAAFFWGLGYAINQITLRYFTALELILFESGFIFIMTLIYCLFQGKIDVFYTKLLQPKSLSLMILSSLIYLLASFFILKSINASNASLAAIIESIYPILTVLFTYLIFGQLQLNMISIFGFILILAGVVIVKIAN